MLCSRALITHQAVAPPAAAVRHHRPRRLVLARGGREPDASQVDGEGPDFGMRDVEALHDMIKKGPDASQYNGEGRDFGMEDVEAFHAARAVPRAPDASQYNGEGSDFDMKDVERFHEEAAKDKAVRRK